METFCFSDFLVYALRTGGIRGKSEPGSGGGS